MSKSQNSYTYLSEEEKLSLLREYHLSGMGKKSFCKKHGIKSESSLRYWEKKYESEKDVVPLQPELDEEDMANRLVVSNFLSTFADEYET